MGWARMLLLGNIGQQMDLDDLTKYLDKATEEINLNQKVDEQQSQEITRLTAENKEMKLYLLGLIRLLSQKGVITAHELNELVEAIDKP